MPLSSSPILQRLRTETRPYHDALEHNRFNQALQAGTVSGALTEWFLAKLYGFLQPYETRLRQQVFAPAWEVDERFRSHLILQDLDLPAAAAPPLCPDMPPLDSWPRLLGAMYVLEGSTLGGQVITRQLAAAGIAQRAYFTGGGTRTGPLWKAFCEQLTAAATPETEAAMVESARLTFQKLHAWIQQP